MLPGQKESTSIRFYVWARSGARVLSLSDEYRTIEEARLDMKQEYWSGRDAVIVKSVTTETVVEVNEPQAENRGAEQKESKQ